MQRNRWASIAARMLVADALGDQECVDQLLVELIDENAARPYVLVSAARVWCAMAVQAGQVFTGGHDQVKFEPFTPDGSDPGSEARWAGALVTAHARGDDLTFEALWADLDDTRSMHVHLLALLDLAGSLVAQGMCVQS